MYSYELTKPCELHLILLASVLVLANILLQLIVYSFILSIAGWRELSVLCDCRRRWDRNGNRSVQWMSNGICSDMTRYNSSVIWILIATIVQRSRKILESLFIDVLTFFQVGKVHIFVDWLLEVVIVIENIRILIFKLIIVGIRARHILLFILIRCWLEIRNESSLVEWRLHGAHS